jgi:nitrate reductase delta subunit
MTSANPTLFKLLSLCLAYPDAAAAEGLPAMEAAAAALPDPLARERLSSFLAHMKTEPLLSLQEHYTAVFDLNPSTSLNLTWHLLGDREDRGRALAELLEVYRHAGLEPAVNELPDHLPLLLEFLSVAPQAMSDPMVSRCLSAVPALFEGIREQCSIYAAPVEVLCGVVPEATSDAQNR